MKLHPLTLRFLGDSSSLETLFQNDNFLASLPHNRAALVIGVLFYSAFGILDVLLMPGNKDAAWLIRFAVVAPVLVWSFILSYSRYFEWYINPLMSFVSIVAGWGIIFMTVTSPSPVNYYYYAGIMLVFIWGYTFVRIPFLWASFAGWVQVVLYEIAAVWISPTPIIVLINNNFFFISANIMGMIACYSLEYNTRRNYFLMRQIDADREKTIGIIRTLEQEITERKKAEETLVKSETRYRLLAENVHDSILTLDLNLRFTYVSPSIMRITGFSPEEIWKMEVEQLLTPQSYETAVQVLSEELARENRKETINRHIPRTFELELISKDEGIVWIELTTTFRWDDQGRPLDILVVARDITKRKQSDLERELLVGKLQQALADVKTLRGLIPICANCKKIRDDQGYWKQIESYISEHSDAVFSHGICPECMKKFYSDLAL